MGFCEINEAYWDVQQSFFNKNKFICEISPNIMYQYVLMVLWYMFIVSIGISIIGLISNITGHLYNMFCFTHKSLSKRRMIQMLTLREAEYLAYIQKKNMVIYGEVLRKLKQQRSDMVTITDNFENGGNKFV